MRWASISRAEATSSGPLPGAAAVAVGLTPYRCGRSCQINSISGLCITKLDVLDRLDTIRVCVGYNYEGGLRSTPPTGAEAFAHCEPVYEDLPGWHASTEGITCYSELPDYAKAYLERLAALTETPIDMISTGPERSATIVLKKLLE